MVGREGRFRREQQNEGKLAVLDFFSSNIFKFFPYFYGSIPKQERGDEKEEGGDEKEEGGDEGGDE